MEAISTSARQTKDLGKKIAKKLRGGEVLALYGDLGAGKTTFVQGLAQGLRIRGPIISPTFVIVRQYKAGVLTLYHVDLYRLKDFNEVREIGLEEILGNKKAVVVIEWPEKAEKILPKKRTTRIRFEIIDEKTRKITITSQADEGS